MIKLVAPTTLAILALLAPAASAEPSVQEQVFDPSCVSQIELTAPQTSIDNLYADPKGAYQPATMSFDICGAGTQVFGPLNVTFRLKGSGSFRSLDGKAAFKVKMPSGQRIDGLKSLTLNNMVQDDSAVHEMLAYEAYGAAGVPGPRAGYANVSLNGADYGLHANVETIDDRFLAAHFASTQHLYEAPDHLSGHVSAISRDVAPDAVENFQVEQGDDDEISDLETLAAATTIAGDDEWWQTFQQRYNVDDVLKFWATATYLGDSDSYVSFVNNFFLHSDAGSVFTFLPWGTDRSFEQDVPLDPPPGVPTDNVEGTVFKRCIAHPGCRAAYADARDDVVEGTIALDLVGRAHQHYATIASAIALDPRKEMTLGEHCHAVDATIAFLIWREQVWDEELRRPGAPPSAQSSQRLDCSQYDPPAPGPASPDSPAADVTAPKLKSVSVRRAVRAGRKRRYTLNVRATDDHGAVAVQIRTFGSRIHRRQIDAGGRVTLITAATSIRLRVVDGAGNAGAWTAIRLDRRTTPVR
ncbi:MAG: CotH kinase family protein [Actinobacteria bacterium]|nr:CotH kinase family protein [Actinomycetota bacterium]